MKKCICYIILLLTVGCTSEQHVLKRRDLSAFPSEIKYADNYGGHLQGFTSDYKNSLYWSHTTQLVKTDFSGNILKVIDVPFHHGDMEYYKGRIYVAVNLGLFNEKPGLSDSWVYIYDAKDLRFIKKYPIPEVIYGAGGIAIHDKKVMIVGGLPASDGFNKNPVYEYKLDFELQKVHWLDSGYTYKGIQIATYYNGSWYFGCYGNVKKAVKPVVLKAKLLGKNLSLINIYDLDYSHGMIGLGGNKWFVSNKTFDKRAKLTAFGE